MSGLQVQNALGFTRCALMAECSHHGPHVYIVIPIRERALAISRSGRAPDSGVLAPRPPLMALGDGDDDIEDGCDLLCGWRVSADSCE
jgi:hypothetical protein